LDTFATAAVAVVDEYLPHFVRTSPLMISSLARSGKTTALNALFPDVHPVIISFSGNSGFVQLRISAEADDHWVDVRKQSIQCRRLAPTMPWNCMSFVNSSSGWICQKI
jgi:hypothetical protein